MYPLLYEPASLNLAPEVPPTVLLYSPLCRQAVLNNDITGTKPNQVLPHFRITTDTLSTYYMYNE